MSKELNIIEAMEMPVGTKFNIVFKEGEKFSQTFKLSESVGLIKFKWEDGEFVEITKDLINAKFIPIEKPVSFIEAIKQNHYNNKTIRCEVNDKIYTYEPVEIKTIEVRAKETNGDISTEEILNGKWYIEY